MAQDSFEMNPTQLTALENASMPQDSDAEFSILSAMILSEEIRGECLIRLSSEDFYIPSNQIIFEAIKSLFDNSESSQVRKKNGRLFSKTPLVSRKSPRLFLRYGTLLKCEALLVRKN